METTPLPVQWLNGDNDADACFTKPLQQTAPRATDRVHVAYFDAGVEFSRLHDRLLSLYQHDKSADRRQHIESIMRAVIEAWDEHGRQWKMYLAGTKT